MPDITGTYDTLGVFEGRAYAKWTEDFSHLWWDSGVEKWTISQQLGIQGDSWWESDAGIIGTYSPLGTATGIATVAKGVWP